MVLGSLRVAVIGAGIGGLAAAIALAARRAHVTVFEQAPALAEVGAGIQVGPNGVAVIEALGLRDAAEACADLPGEIVLANARSGRTVGRVPLGQKCVARYGRPYWHFHRADLLEVLRSGAEAAGVELRLGSRVIATDQDTSGARLRLETGGEVTADIVVGADGIRSSLRREHFGGAPPRYTGHVAWRGLLDARALPAGMAPGGALVTMGPGRHLVSYPLRGGQLINFVAVERRGTGAEEGWMAEDDPAALRAAFAGWDPRSEALLAAVERTFLWGLFDHPPLPRWADGRLALLGDACHPMLPFLAQGATMALEDAWVLAAEVAVADTPERGLMAYETRRKPRAARVQRAAAGNGRVFHLTGVARSTADIGLSAASALAPGLLLSRFDWLYGADVVSARATA